MSTDGQGTSIYERFHDTISRFVVGYNKSIVQSQITHSSFTLVERNFAQIKNELSSVVAAFEEIRATSESTSRNAEQIDSRMEQLVSKSHEVASEVTRREVEIREASANATRIGQLFQQLAERSNDIQKASSEIHDVSERTNVLAINASIEAARVGNIGSGFRIIAGEVKKLATQTGAFADGISDVTLEFARVLKEINQQMAEFMELLGRLDEDFKWLKHAAEDTAHEAHQTGTSIAQITGAIGEQNLALNDGLKTLESSFQYLSSSHTVLRSLVTTHDALDLLLNRPA